MSYCNPSSSLRFRTCVGARKASNDLNIRTQTKNNCHYRRSPLLDRLTILALKKILVPHEQLPSPRACPGVHGSFERTTFFTYSSPLKDFDLHHVPPHLGSLHVLWIYVPTKVATQQRVFHHPVQSRSPLSPKPVFWVMGVFGTRVGFV